MKIMFARRQRFRGLGERRALLEKNYWIATANEKGRRHDKHKLQPHFVNKRLLRLHGKTGDVHRSRIVRHHICRRNDRKRHVGVDICSEQADEERAQYLHNQSSAR